ncbi:hypothetical protein AB0N89_06060 [Amycolatopsis sp. NPDC089917]|uniref:hypothetical protein n=1 Tax=Amycolatopsis sp. NPDC089917 TaxID=3155187 RepID=UPI0034427108
MAATVARASSLLTRSLLQDRVLVATSAASVSDAVGEVLCHGFSGIVIVDEQCARVTRTVKGVYGSRLLVGKDTAAYMRYTAMPSESMYLPSILGAGSLSLAQCMQYQLVDGADFALTPTGRVRDLATLDAVVTEANTLAMPGVVVAVPVPARMLTGAERAGMVAILERSRHPVALIVTGQFDPFAAQAVADGLRVVTASAADVFLHRSDFAVFEALAHGGLGGAIGYLASLRHTVTGRRPAKTRKEPPDRSPIVLLPEIDSFRHQAVYEPWFRNVRPPICALPGCCGRDLSTLTNTRADHAVANLHNLRAWLPLGAQLTTTPVAGRRGWLHAYRQTVEAAYVDLRRRTRIRTISMDDSQRTWLTLGL